VKRRRWVLAGLVIVVGCVVAVAIASRGGGRAGPPNGGRFASAARPDGLVNVRTIGYRSSLDGSTVSALVATPRAAPSRGCVIWENGLDTRPDNVTQAAQGFAGLGLSTFSIGIREQGMRTASAAEANQATSDAKRLSALIRGTAADLRSAIEYLDKQSYCAHNVAYVGISLGGIIGALLAATDERVKALALLSTPATFRMTLTTDNGPFLPGVARSPSLLETSLRALSPLDPERYVGRIAPRPVLIVSGVQDKTVVISDARRLQAATREPKTIVDYHGGHDPLAGSGAAGNAEAVASFLLRHVVERTYGVRGNTNGTFVQR
jgi:fermentation-respiration switch protein FrsA (DUF1100 family)